MGTRLKCMQCSLPVHRAVPSVASLQAADETAESSCAASSGEDATATSTDAWHTYRCNPLKSDDDLSMPSGSYSYELNISMEGVESAPGAFFLAL